MNPKHIRAKQSVQKILKECSDADRDVKNQIERYQDFLTESELKHKDFAQVLSILRELEGNECNIVETLFDYKLNDVHEQENESKMVTREYHNKKDVSSQYDKQKSNSHKMLIEQTMRRKKTF